MTSDYTIKHSDLAAIIKIMEQMHALKISMYDETFLCKTILKRINIANLDNITEYSAYLCSHASEAAKLFQSLRINFSEFFRNPYLFAMLEQQILPALLSAKKKSGETQIRVWSVGCATGQEPWSVAMLLEELLENDTRFSYHIFATDISAEDLSYAQVGVYDQKALDNVRYKYLRKFFSIENDKFSITHQIRNQVEFSMFDLLDTHSICPAESLYGDFDLIICCNLLFYYQPDVLRIILKKLYQALAHNGYFMTGETEVELVAHQGYFQALTPPNAIFKKNIHHVIAPTNSAHREI